MVSYKSRGYIYIGSVKRCRIVAEKKIGRPLKKWEIVHHINDNKIDDRPENLQVMSMSEHMKIHSTGRLLKEETKEKLSLLRINKNYDEIYGEEKARFIKQKISENNARYWKGKTRDEQTKKKISLRFKNNRLSEEHKKKISDNHQSKKEGYVNPFRGKKHNEETKIKMKEKQKELWKSGFYRDRRKKLATP